MEGRWSRRSRALHARFGAVAAGAATIAVALMAASCGGRGPASSPGSAPGSPTSAFATPFSNDKVYPSIVSSEITVGENRFLVALLNQHDAPVGSPRVSMHVSFFDLHRSSTTPVTGARMHWVWIHRPYVGVYEGEVSFDRPGRWGASVRLSGTRVNTTVRSSFDVIQHSSTPGLGERVPASQTPTAEPGRSLRRISTDPHPDPRFYSTSVAEALKRHEPFVVVFATPKFCISKTCGPMLDTVKRVSRDFPHLTFIHVEPYVLPADPSHLQPVPETTQWGLPSEPWTFAVDSRGRLDAKYEGAVSERELHGELEHLR